MFDREPVCASLCCHPLQIAPERRCFPGKRKRIIGGMIRLIGTALMQYSERTKAGNSGVSRKSAKIRKDGTHLFFICSLLSAFPSPNHTNALINPVDTRIMRNTVKLQVNK